MENLVANWRVGQNLLEITVLYRSRLIGFFDRCSGNQILDTRVHAHASLCPDAQPNWRRSAGVPDPFSRRS